MRSVGRVLALVAKELKLMLRDPTALMVGILMPLMFIVLFGWAMSMDIKDIKLTVVLPEMDDSFAKEVVARFKDNGYFVVHVTDSPKEAARRLSLRQADVTLTVAPALNRKTNFGEGQFLICVNGTQAPIAQSYRGTVQGVLQAVIVAASAASLGPGLDVRYQLWFNPANNSRWFIIPGVIVVIMSVIGCLLTAMQVAKEYESGTMESVFATPVTPLEVLVSKMLGNYVVGMVGLALAVLLGCVGFGVPMRGSPVWLYVGSTLFLCAQMALGLVISACTKSQFIAAIMASNFSFMPAMLLSGFVYEITNMPVALQWLTRMLPARYYCEFLKTFFLVGDTRAIYVQTLVPLAGFLVVFLAWATKSLSKQQKEARK